MHIELFDRAGEVSETLPGLCDNEFRKCLRLSWAFQLLHAIPLWTCRTWNSCEYQLKDQSQTLSRVKTGGQSVSKLVSQSVFRSISQSVCMSVSQSVCKSVNQSVSLSTSQSVSLLFSQSANLGVESLSGLVASIFIGVLTVLRRLPSPTTVRVCPLYSSKSSSLSVVGIHIHACFYLAYIIDNTNYI
jgi:hypothetical protein